MDRIEELMRVLGYIKDKITDLRTTDTITYNSIIGTSVPLDGGGEYMVCHDDGYLRVICLLTSENYSLKQHSHLSVQTSIVVDGEMHITIDGNTNVLNKGDSITVPAMSLHSLHTPKASIIISTLHALGQF